MSIVNSPMLATVQEKRIIVDGNEVILRVGNVPVVKSLQALIALGESLQADLTKEKMNLLSVCEAESVRLDEISDEILRIDKEVSDLTAEYGDELKPADPRRKLLRQFNKLQAEQEIIESHVNATKAVKHAEVFTTLGRKGMRGVLEIVCPDTKITEAILDSITFSDVYDIVELFIKVNRLDLLPKKILPQNLQERLLKLVSGEL